MLKRILFTLLMAACHLQGFAQETQTNLTPASEDQKSLAIWVSGSGINICSAGKNVPLTCVLKEMPKKVGKATSVVSGNFLPQAGASWLVQSNQGSNLCAVDLGKNRLFCRKIQTANLQGLTITGSEIASNGMVLPQLTFSNQLELTKDVELTLKNNFLLAFNEARETLLKSLTSSLDDSEDCSIETASLCNENTEPEGDNTIVEDTTNDKAVNSLSLPSTSAINSACTNACTAAYDSTSATCRRISNSRARAVCWAAAATAYGICLARC